MVRFQPLLASAWLLFLACDQSPSLLATGGQIVLRGERPSAEFGLALDLVGDLNGDGFGDVVIGAPGDSRSGTEAGAVYVYSGSAAGISQTPSAILLGGPQDRFGSSVCGVGDVNGDGLDDFAVGAVASNRQGILENSAVHLFYGRAAGLLTTPEEIAEGVRYTENANLTLVNDFSDEVPVVGSAGDLDHDGRVDLAVGLPAQNRVVVFLNGSAFPDASLQSFSQASLQLLGKTSGDGLGASLGAVGNVDGFNRGLVGRFGDDLLIGAPNADGKGKAYLILGRSGLAGTVSVETLGTVFTGDQAGDSFGASVAGVGDFDGDGFGDILIGAPGQGAGYAEVYFGRSLSGPDAFRLPLRLEGERVGDGFGASVSGSLVSDVLGSPALYVGAPQSSFGPSGGGLMFQFTQALYPSDTSGSGITLSASVADQRFQNLYGGSGTSADFGSAVASGLDLNGDGNGDLLVGAPNSDTAGQDAGQVSIYW